MKKPTSKVTVDRIIKASEIPIEKEMVWVLWYLDSNEQERFCGSFPTEAEAHEHQREGLGHLRRADWRYCVSGYPARLLRRLDNAVGVVAC